MLFVCITCLLFPELSHYLHFTGYYYLVYSKYRHLTRQISHYSILVAAILACCLLHTSLPVSCLILLGSFFFVRFYYLRSFRVFHSISLSLVLFWICCLSLPYHPLHSYQRVSFNQVLDVSFSLQRFSVPPSLSRSIFILLLGFIGCVIWLPGTILSDHHTLLFNFTFLLLSILLFALEYLLINIHVHFANCSF